MPLIAGCSGGWSASAAPGTKSSLALEAQCGLESGNSHATNPNGNGCSISDLCAPGWHVCDSRQEVALRAPNASCADPTTGMGIWVVRQAMGTGTHDCAVDDVNNLVGCGNLGDQTAQWSGVSCVPLTRFFGLPDHPCPAPWVWAPVAGL